MSERPAAWNEIKSSLASLPGVGKVALACAALALVLLLAPLWDLGVALYGPRPTIPPIKAAAENTTKRKAAFEVYAAQTKGRSLFYNPKAVSAAPPVAVENPTPEDTRPRSYGGPSIVAMVFDEVWFADGKRLKVGGDSDGDVRVVAMQPPWSATIAWRGVEFPVSFFERGNVVFKDMHGSEPPPSSPGSSDTPPEPSAGTPSEGTPAATEQPVPPSGTPSPREPTESRNPPAATPGTPNRNQE
ncbi:MAG: hypothetical protein HBSAPP03_27730 [Phycisphaerae bacterium]|nr:MAG: hypothetical protein HBSAPP03_27730 [Phycisphaerae bacterium]